MGACYHHDQEDIDTPSVLEEILQVCGFPANLAAAAEDETWDTFIEADMDQAIAKVGYDVGVPLIVLDDDKGVGFFELKRTREVGPLFGERPKIW